jgi:hypothetical protein
VQYFLDQKQYESAIQSYKKVDCGTASEQFSQIISAFRLIDFGQYVPRSQAKKAECDFFEDAVSDQKAGRFDSALLNYAKVAVYEDSILLEPIRSNVRELFQKSKIASLTRLEVCSRLRDLEQGNLLPKSNANLPSLYLKCGNLFEADKSYYRAIATYEQFLKQYPNHVLTEDVKRALARTIVSDVKGNGAQNIKSPGRTGTTADGTTVIEIQNTSPAKMQIAFSGATPKFEEIEACRDCVTYLSKPPDLCSGKGFVGRYKLEPGQYDIAVKFTANDGNPVNPWAGTWNLKAGTEYKSCFFIIRYPSDNLEKKKNSQ